MVVKMWPQKECLVLKINNDEVYVQMKNVKNVFWFLRFVFFFWVLMNFVDFVFIFVFINLN